MTEYRKSKYVDGPNDSGYFTTGIDAKVPGFGGQLEWHGNAVAFYSKKRAEALARRDIAFDSLSDCPISIQANICEAWHALGMIREAIETLGPAGSVAASEHLAGPTFTHEAEALVAGIMTMVVDRKASTLSRGIQIEEDFFELKAQEFGPRATKDEIKAAVKTALDELHPPVFVDDPATWPAVHSVWRHRNGTEYCVTSYANVEGDRDKYPTMIIYTNVKNGRQYARRLDDWSRSMKAVK